jgi:hypothetical protein
MLIKKFGSNNQRMLLCLQYFQEKIMSISGVNKDFLKRRGKNLAYDQYKCLEMLVNDDNRCYICYRGNKTNFAGICEPNFFNNETKIEIFRKRADKFEFEDLFTLAHEYGHHLSHINNQRTENYEKGKSEIEKTCNEGKSLSQAYANLTRLLKIEVLEEEARAWLYAKEILSKINFDAWTWFNDHIKNSFENYKRVIRL